ncbi:MAG TPA: hypothetical protein VIQ31_03770, partial [Phormidium sp.]
AIISLSKCSLLLSILGSFKLAKCYKKLVIKRFLEGNESVCFSWELTALLKPLAIDSIHKIQQNTWKFSRI